MSEFTNNSLASRFDRLVDTMGNEISWNVVQELADLGHEIQNAESRHCTKLPHARSLWKELDKRMCKSTISDRSVSTQGVGTMPTTEALPTRATGRLYTSIPPFDAEFARQFCAAWNHVGFEICTVNSSSECQVILAWGIPGLQVMEAPRDASCMYGRPLVYIRDIVDIIGNEPCSSNLVGIVNADIMPSPLQNWRSLSDQLAKNSFHCFKRAELQMLANGLFLTDPSTYRYGYDLFLWRDGARLECGGDDLAFAFGVPWWDYWFPLERMLAGDDVISHETCWILHKSHEANFDTTLFENKGNEFLRYMQTRNAFGIDAFEDERTYSTDELCSFCAHCTNRIDAYFLSKSHAAAEKKPDGVSVVTACMNRNDNLLQAIRSWIVFDEIKEIIVVDWSSTTKVAETLQGIDDRRIRIIRIEGRTNWILSHAYNAGLREARYGLTLKLDADVVLTRGFFDQHKPDEDLFYAGNWRTAGNDSEKRLNGSFFASTRIAHASGLYNEYITTYGWDDCDLYTRFEKMAKRVDFDKAYLRHCEQESSSRISNQASKLGLCPLEVSPEVETELEIRVNEYLAFLSPDWHHSADMTNDLGNARALAYRFALINELSKDYQSNGIGFSLESLAEFSLDGLLVLFACRHNQYFWRSQSPSEFYQKISCVPWSPADAMIVSLELRNLMARESSDRMLLALSTTCDRMLFRSKVRFTQTANNLFYNGLIPLSRVMPDLVPSFYEQVSIKARGKRVTSVSTVFNSDKHIHQFIEDLTKQTAFDRILFIFIICNSRQHEFRPLHNFCNQHPDNTILINLTHDPGLYESWNMAAVATTTDYMTNWNTDDRRSPNHIEKLMAILDERPDIDLASAALYVSYEANTSFHAAASAGLQTWFNGPDRLFTDSDLFQLNTWEEPDPAKRVVVSQNFAHCMPVWRVSMHHRFGYFNEHDYGPSADWEFWLRAGREGARFFLHGDVLGVYYLNTSSYGRRTEASTGDYMILKEYLIPKIENKLRGLG